MPIASATSCRLVPAKPRSANRRAASVKIWSSTRPRRDVLRGASSVRAAAFARGARRVGVAFAVAFFGVAFEVAFGVAFEVLLVAVTPKS